MDPFDLRKWPGFSQAGGDPGEPAIVDQITTDSRRISSRNALFVPLAGSKTDGHAHIQHAESKGCKYTLAATGAPLPPLAQMKTLAVENPLNAFQEIATAYRLELRCKMVAIIGTCGKTMVKDLLADILQKGANVAASPESFNSQIGVPLSVLTVDSSHKIALIEAAFSNTGEMARLTAIIQPHDVIVTHIGSKHITSLGTLETTANEIALMANAPSRKGWVVHPGGSFEPTFNRPRWDWSVPCRELPHCLRQQERCEIRFPDGDRFAFELPGNYPFAEDLINLAIKPACLLGATKQHLTDTLKAYQPDLMRTEIWHAPMGATLVSETYGSDPQSVDQALKHFEQSDPRGKKIFVFGGLRSRGATHANDLKRIAESINRSRPDTLHLVGDQDFGPLRQALSIAHVCQSRQFPDALAALKDGLDTHDTVVIKGAKKFPLDQITEAFCGSVYTNQCLVNLAAIGSNLAKVRKKLGVGTRVMAMVKAGAYGTHDIKVARFLETHGIDIFGVSYPDEAVALRLSGIKSAIFCLNAAPYEAAKVAQWELEVGVSDPSVIRKIAEEAARRKKRIKVHLHVDTGMKRLGCRPEEAGAIAELIANEPNLKLEGIFSHLAAADDPSQDAFTKSQVTLFEKTVDALERKGIPIPWKHLANSSGILRFEFPQFNMARIGLALYGFLPGKATGGFLDLKLAVTLTSRITGINHCLKGETVSYGRRYTGTKDLEKIAVIPVGYYDGLHRHYSGKGSVLIRGRKAPMVGSICMDYLMADITDIPGAAIGDSVLIFGEDDLGNHLAPEDLADQGGSIVYELMTCLGPRIQRIFIHEENQKAW